MIVLRRQQLPLLLDDTNLSPLLSVRPELPHVRLPGLAASEFHDHNFVFAAPYAGARAPRRLPGMDPPQDPPALSAEHLFVGTVTRSHHVRLVHSSPWDESLKQDTNWSSPSSSKIYPTPQPTRRLSDLNARLADRAYPRIAQTLDPREFPPDVTADQYRYEGSQAGYTNTEDVSWSMLSSDVQAPIVVYRNIAQQAGDAPRQHLNRRFVLRSLP
ncbi:MAG: hypothetical protein U0836_27595 [Pirellulales bacterium]